MRIASGREAGALVERLAERRSRLGPLKPRVRRIVDGVRGGGEPALRRDAARWDGLAPKQPLRVTAKEMAGALGTGAPPRQKSLRESAQNILPVCGLEKPSDWMV